VEKQRQRRKNIVRSVDPAVKTIYSPFIACRRPHFFSAKDPIVNHRPAITTSSNRHAVVVAFAFAGSMGKRCAIAANRQPTLLALGYVGRMHPGMEDV
jgi:hypothetical protein